MKKPRFVAGRFIAVLEESLRSILEPVLYRDERGFQGALLHELNVRLGHGVLPDDPIVQQEYQKRIRDHGIKIRPDIIVHVPFERGAIGGRDEGNFVAIELKRKATSKLAKQAFASLAQMKKVLKYSLTVFINLDSEQTHAALYPKSIADQTVCFTAWLHNGKPVVKAEEPGAVAQKRKAAVELSRPHARRR